VLVLPGTIDPPLAAEARAVVSELAASSGLEFVEVATVSPTEANPAWKVVIIAVSPSAEPDPVYPAAAQAYPQTQFVLVGSNPIPDSVQMGDNWSLITPADESQAFLAGYIAALSSHEWRVGMLSRGDSPQAIARREAFMNGVSYLCGVCNPKYPPYVHYPVYAEAASSTDWTAGVEALVQQGVNVVYVEPSLQTEELLATLFGKGMNLVGGVSPVFSTEEITPETSGRWIATVRQDALETLRNVWGELLAGGGGKGWQAALVVQDRNPDLLSSARLRLVEETHQALSEGWIFPANVPSQ